MLKQSTYDVQRHLHLSPAKVCEQEFHNTLTLVITLDIEPTLCAYKHKIVFDMGSCWKGFEQYIQCGLEFIPGDITRASECYLRKNICRRRTTDVSFQMF
jgi:hypothetical protein